MEINSIVNIKNLKKRTQGLNSEKMLMKIASGYFLFISILILLQSISTDSTSTETKVDATSEIPCNSK